MRVLRDNTRHNDLTARLNALRRVIELCDGRVPDAALAPARDVIERAAERLRLSLDQTTVAFGGPTGTGKSSLFNALVGIGLSPVGIRRPTTVTTVACVWDPAGMPAAKPLLDRIGVPNRQQLPRRSALDRSGPDELTGLILLDLPDYDSAAPEHRSEVDQVVELTDAMVWVTDPQKYADNTWHQRYLRNLTHHAEVQVVVLNQIDKLPPEDVGVCVEDLTRLLASDGLAEVEVIACSARTGTGVGRLRSLLAELVASHNGAVERLAADVDRAVEDLTEDCLGPVSLTSRHTYGSVGVSDAAREALVTGLAEAAGVTLLAETVADSHAAGATAAAAAPVARLWRHARSGPRLQMRLPRLARVGAEPAPVPLQPTAARAAVEALVAETVDGLPAPWAEAVVAVGETAASDVVTALDKELGGVTVPTTSGRVSPWWTFAGIVQWLLMFSVLVGVSGAAAWPFMHSARLPEPAGLPLPYWLLVLGVVASVALAQWCRAAARRVAGRRRDAIVGDLRKRVAEATTGAVVEPIEAELDVFRAMHEAFGTARSR